MMLGIAGIKLEIEKLKSDRKSLKDELDKALKDGDTSTAQSLESRIARIDETLEAKGHKYNPDAEGASKPASPRGGGGTGDKGAATATTAIVSVDLADKEESWKLGKLSLDEVGLA